MATFSWVSKGLFETALRKYLNNKNIEVVEYSGGAIKNSDGESYCSEIFRTTITYKIEQNTDFETIAVLVKRAPEASKSLRFTIELNYYQKEIDMFEITLPKLNGILRNVGAVSARSLYTQLDPFPLLILEDCSALGYKMCDCRREGLDLEHCLFVVKKLAQFHAASLVIYDEDPKAFNNYSESMFWGKPIIHEWIQLSSKALIDACSKSPALQEYATKLLYVKNKIPERAAAAAELKPGGFHVLNHGDPWTNNFLFSYENDGRVKDMIFVDYQVVVYGSPAIDLHYFLTTSPTIEVHQKHLETILQYYYDTLLSNLEELECKPLNLPTFEEFRSDWFSRAYYGLVSAMTVLPLIKSESRNDANFENLLAAEKNFDGSFQQHVFNNSVLLEHLENLLPFFDRVGVFNY